MPVRPLSTRITCTASGPSGSPSRRGPWIMDTKVPTAWPVAARDVNWSMPAKSLQRAITFSIPTRATCTLGALVVNRMLPSFSMSASVPVSATRKFPPVMPMSAVRNASRRAARAAAARSSGVASSGVPCTRWNSFWMSSRLLWIAGPRIWLGGSPKSWMTYSPRSVSTTSIPRRSSASFTPSSSESMLFPFTTWRTPCSAATASSTLWTSAAVSAQCTTTPFSVSRRSASSR